GDNSTSGITQGLVIPHTYALGGVYMVKLMVIGKPCPVSRNAVATTIIVIAGEQVYLPLVLKSGAGGATSTAATPEVSGVTTPEASGEVFSLNVTPGSPAQVTGLQGNEPGNGTTTLVWNPSSPDNVVLGYRLYRSPIGAVSFQRLAEVSADVTTYSDATATCGQMYFVTAYNAEGESLPSTASYFSPPCQ
ncbi:MAG: fibronectin type III domain-containing protein, partial [Chloroflexi bacterium]|nr:fibronectin type III domain-containing protein [Chloroflexota bacterium]